MTNYEFDEAVRSEGYAVVCGVDEAGRGPLAGPVFAAAVILRPDVVIDGINDSKKLTEKKREALFDVILKEASAYSIASASVEEIESLNILQATFLAMKRAVHGPVCVTGAGVDRRQHGAAGVGDTRTFRCQGGRLVGLDSRRLHFGEGEPRSVYAGIG